MATVPPAASMRACSPGRYGLWSMLISTASPRRTRMARLSPQLPTKMCVGVTSAVMAVLPLWSSPRCTSGAWGVGAWGKGGDGMGV
jgi:hypothetical protein